MTDAGRIRLVILGCTGSIGQQALDVCRQHPDRIEVVALSAHSRTAELVAAAREFNVPLVAVTDDAHVEDPCLSELPKGTKLLTGVSALAELADTPEADTVLVAVVGAVSRTAESSMTIWAPVVPTMEGLGAAHTGRLMEKTRMAVKTAVAFFFISIIPFQNLCGFSISTAKAVNTYTSS